MKSRIYVSLLMVAILLLTVGAPVLAATATVKIVVSATDLDIGQTVTVYIDIADVSPIMGAEAHVVFDASRLEVIDADPGVDGVQIAHGDFLAPEFVAQNIVNNTTGSIDYAISQMSSADASGSGRLAVITFRTKASGTANINLTDVKLAAAGGVEIPASMTSGSLVILPEVTPTPDVTATPEPTATPGPTETPEPEPTESPIVTPTPLPPTATPAPAPTCTFQGHHTVMPGQTFYSIGRAYATRPDQIAACNGMTLSDVLYVGKVLGIPVAPWSPVPPGPTAVRQFDPGGSVPDPEPVCRYYHKVMPAETLTLIGWRYGANIWDIARANNILNLNLIYVGQVLCIP